MYLYFESIFTFFFFFAFNSNVLKESKKQAEVAFTEKEIDLIKVHV